MEEKEYPFEFSVIMAVYNVEPWLRAAVDSVIDQDFGFEKVQLIMVDDGSTDDSGMVCDEYARRYPENMLVIHKKNGGASSARNAGARVAKGRYLNFMDPDDKLDRKVLSSVHAFFSEHEKETAIVAIPFRMFGLSHGPHPTNEKFSKGTRVINLQEEWWHVQMSLASGFFVSEVAKKYCFQEDLKMASAEDAKEILKILIQNPKLGVIDNVFYRYRRREGSQVSQNAKLMLSYTANLEDYCLWAIQHSIKEIGYVPKFIQFALLYHIQWKLREQELPSDLFTPETAEEYRRTLNEVLRYIDNDVIMRKKAIYTEQKSYAIMQKSRKFPEKVYSSGDLLFACENIVCFRMGEFSVVLEFAELTKDSFVVEGWIPYYTYLDVQKPDIYLKGSGIVFEGERIERTEKTKIAGTTVMERIGFKFVIPLADVKTMQFHFYCRTPYGNVRMRRIRYGKFFPISDEIASNYFWKNGWKLWGSRNRFFVSACGKQGHLASELAFLKELWKKNKVGYRKAVFARLACHVLKWFKRKPIWLICDKADRADDNGEAFFKYVQKFGHGKVKPIFLVGKGSKDYKRLSKIGKTVPYMSWRHKQLFLIADCIISAYSHNEIDNPFFEYNAPYRNLMQNCKFIFLQHGITKADVSKSLNRHHKNISGFVTAAETERNSILETPGYQYNEKNIWLTGFPRHDYLYHNEKKAIVIMPTWRQRLFGGYSAKNSRWTLKEGFRESEYYLFYQGLLNHYRLLKRAQELGYQINFVPHPILFPYIDEFSVPEPVKMWGTEVVYRDMFAENQLLVTDFSSVAFDFAYLRKPVLYAQFDISNYDEGYFNDVHDGFGEVEYDLESTVNRIIEYMENGCQLKDKYRERIEKFFAFNDQNNCKRVYEKIMEMERA